MTVTQLVLVLLSIMGGVASAWFIYERVFPFRRLSWRNAQKAAIKISNQMKNDGFSPTLIVGIGRGGAIMGAMISGCLGHRPLLVIDRRYMWTDGRRIDDMILHLRLPPGLIQAVLLTAGEAHSGNTMRLYFQFLSRMGATTIRRAAFFVQKGCTEPIEYVGVRRNRDLLMPWMFTRDYVRGDRGHEGRKVIDHLPTSPTGEPSAELASCYLVRHGESTDNSNGDRYSGITDCLLTENGVAQAQAAGRFLQDKGVRKIYTSPMKRAIATARQIQSIAGGQLIVDGRLREIDYGEWEGLTRKEVFERWPDLYSSYKQDPVANIPPGGESPERVADRVRDFWDDLQLSLRMEGVRGAAIVTHNSVARILLCFVSDTPLHKYREKRIENASVTKVVWDSFGKTAIEYENLTEHLT